MTAELPAVRPARDGNRAELAQFLRTWRGRLQPADLGLTSGTRRRTPGLRREEVAQLAGVGASWYTWLEQGRDIQVSAALLERLAQVLRLSPTERGHLFELAQGRPAAQRVTAPAEVSPVLRRMIDAHPYPAMASNLRRDILAHNAATTTLYGDFGDPPHNGLWDLFLHAERRHRTVDWERAARRAVASFRLDAARASDRAGYDELVDRLARASHDFARLWTVHEVIDEPEGVKRIDHPAVGVIAFEHVTLNHLEPDGRALRVSFYSPRPGIDLERARRLFSS